MRHSQPEHPHPAQVDDCYAAPAWMGSNATSLGFDSARLAVYGGSAGGSLAIATSLKARDEGTPATAYTMAAYPMVDHRNVLPSTYEVTELGVWRWQTGAAGGRTGWISLARRGQSSARGW